MKFNMSDMTAREMLVDVEVPEWLTSAGEWGALHAAIGLAALGHRGTAAKEIVAVVERVRKEALDMALQARVEAYIAGHRDGWGEACEVEQDKTPMLEGYGGSEVPIFLRPTPVTDARRPWEDMTDQEKAEFRAGVAKTIDLTVRVHNEHWRPSATAVAKEVIGGNQD